MTTALVLALLTLPVGGVAWAWWSTSGAGTANGSAIATVALTTTASTANATTLVPGGAADLVVTVTNPNSRAVTLTSATLDSSRTVTVAGAVGPCTAPPLAVSATLDQPLAAGATTTVTLPSAVTLGASAASGCQGASFTVPVTLVGRMP